MGTSLIIAAAGSGSRMQHSEKKQFIELMGIPIVIRTLEVFKTFPGIDQYVIVTGKDDVSKMQGLLKSYGFSDVLVVVGGDTRQESIYEALKVVTQAVVMIHDGARPFVSHDILQANLEAIKLYDGVITCVPCKDTIKVIEEGFVKETLDRSKLVNVQTPQTFKTDLIQSAYHAMFENKWSVTDDASLMERMSKKIKTVMGSYENIKVTTPEDLIIGEQLLRGAV